MPSNLCNNSHWFSLAIETSRRYLWNGEALSQKRGAKVIISDEQGPAGGFPITVPSVDRYAPTEKGDGFGVTYLTQSLNISYEITVSQSGMEFGAL